MMYYSTIIVLAQQMNNVHAVKGHDTYIHFVPIPLNTVVGNYGVKIKA